MTKKNILLKKNAHPLITVFTPTFNRAYTLKRLFDSLCRQTSFNFEWLIIDDGSTDNTNEICNTFITDNFAIKYIKQTNGGKHRAINAGVKIANGELFFIVDSDDYLTDNAIQEIEFYWNNRKKDCLGLCFRKKDYEKDKVLGDNFPKHDFYASSIKLQFIYKMNIDKAEIFRTDILRNNLFPEIEGEKFCTEAVCWLKMAKGKINLLYCIDEAIYLCKYLEDGLTANYANIMKNNPKGYRIYHKLLLSIPSYYLHPKLVIKSILWLTHLWKGII